MAENRKGFFGRQADRLKKLVQNIIDDSSEDSILSLMVGVYHFIVTAIRNLGERFGLWIEDKDKELKEKKQEKED